jgi:hypothetical protein
MQTVTGDPGKEVSEIVLQLVVDVEDSNPLPISQRDALQRTMRRDKPRFRDPRFRHPQTRASDTHASRLPTRFRHQCSAIAVDWALDSRDPYDTLDHY